MAARRRTVVIEVTAPKGARWVSTNPDGCYEFWHLKPYIPEPTYIWSEVLVWCNYELPLRRIETGIPCPEWRDSLRKL